MTSRDQFGGFMGWVSFCFEHELVPMDSDMSDRAARWLFELLRQQAANGWIPNDRDRVRRLLGEVHVRDDYVESFNGAWAELLPLFEQEDEGRRLYYPKLREAMEREGIRPDYE